MLATTRCQATRPEVICDVLGQRHIYRRQGMPDPSLGHKHGADHVENVLNWCQKAGIRHVTVFVCSTENLAKRGDAEVAFLMQVIEQVVADKLSHDPTWQVRLAADLDILPDTTARALKNAVEISRGCTTGAHVTLAVGYGGRQEVIDAFRALLNEHAEKGTTVRSRRSVRGFLDRPVPSDVLRTVLSAALQAPSGGNLQPWHVYVVSGAKLDDLKARVRRRVAAGDPRGSAAGTALPAMSA